MLWETVLLAQREIRRNVLRSSLTILGIVIGVAAVITLVTIGSGATAQVAEQIGSLGSNMLFVSPGQGPRGPGGASASAKNLKLDDVEAIARDIPGLAAVAPTASAATQAIYGNENWSTSLMGSTNDYFRVRNWPLQSGRKFSSGEIRSGRSVCILGVTVKKELFRGQDAIGQSLRLHKTSFQVIGVLESKGQGSFGNDQDDFLVIPIRTFQRRIAGNTDVGAVMVSVQNADAIDKAKSDIERLMRERRRIAAGADDDFHVGDMREIMRTITGTTKVLTALLGAVAAVSLLVGGIGIMNIMLVSITERTREIGIRKAMGARRRDIQWQFLVEALVLSTTGGAVGILLGLIGSWALGNISGWNVTVSVGSILLSFGFSGFVGVFFGLYPARLASRLDPIDALRYE